jgi:hypothetical protein
LVVPSIPPPRPSRTREWIAVGVVAVAFAAVISIAMCSGQEERPQLAPDAPAAK